MYRVRVMLHPGNYHTLLKFECLDQNLASVIGEKVYHFYKEDYQGLSFDLHEEVWTKVESYS